MPFLSEEEVLAFNIKIDELEEKRSNLDELNDDYMEMLKKKTNQLRKSIIVCALLLLCFLGSVVIIIFNNQTDEEVLLTTNKIKEQPIEKKVELSEDKISKKTIIVKEEPLYGVQIGAYKNYDVEYTLEIQKLSKNNLNSYIIGGFSIKEKALELKEFLQKESLKGAFVVELPKKQ